MQYPVLSPPLTIAEVFSQAWYSGAMSRRDWHGLRSVLSDSQVSEEEVRAIDRMLYAVKRGWVKLVD